MLTVICKNKLITIDTVLPILLEIRKYYSTPVVVVVPNITTMNLIKKNHVIYHLITKYNISLLCYKHKNKIKDKARKLLLLFRYLYRLANGGSIIHFGEFDYFPYSILQYIYSDRIYFSQSTNATEFFPEIRWDILNKQRNTKVIKSKKIIIYNHEASIMRKYDASNKKIYYFRETRIRNEWLKNTFYNYNYYFNKYHKKDNLLSCCYCVFILGSFNNATYVSSDDTVKIFRDTVDGLDRCTKISKVIMKPHPVTEIEVVKDIIGDNQKFIFSDIHPSVLAARADFFICNSYSTTMYDAQTLGVPTVEYTSYKNSVKKYTNNRSVGYGYIDYYIDSSREELLNFLENYAGCLKSHEPLKILYDDPSKLLKNIS